MRIVIRPETVADHDAIRQVNLLAFGQMAEGELVHSKPMAFRDDLSSRNPLFKSLRPSDNARCNGT